jgi:hypothetical protein
MKKIALISFLALGALISGCGKSTPPVEPAKAAASAPAADPQAPRIATYDPNLKPGKIVWDSPEKQKAWEARQAEVAGHAPAAQKQAAK